MRLKLLFFIALAYLLVATPGLTLEEKPYPGYKAPGFTLPSLKGETVDLAALYNQGPVWLTLYTTWCPACNVETPALVAASKKHPEIRFIAVSLMEDKAVVEEFQQKFQVPFPMLLDAEGVVTEAYNIRPIPVNVGIRKGGEIAFRRQTLEEAEIPDLIAAITQESGPAATGAIKLSGRFSSLFETFPLLASFVAGLLTFLSPCILPLIPGYIAFITGLELETLLSADKKVAARKMLMISTLAFILGFGLIFTLLGATASALGQFFASFQGIMRIVGGGLLILFGLHLSGALSIVSFYREARFQLKIEQGGLTGAFLLGVVFAVGWTPCVGPILSAILIYAATESMLGKGIAMLGAYSAGIGAPFLLASAFLPQFQRFLNRVKPYFQEIEIGSGILLILLGILLITNRFAYLAGLFPSF
ncbi:MAG: redoxin domain-containing protein [Elusimicrobia bacterium]|nr:redoxin domain-containing protein [Elusimicrobiota bacterium]